MLEIIEIKENIAKVYSGPPQTSKMGRFAALVNGFQSLTFIANLALLDLWGNAEYVFELIQNGLNSPNNKCL